MIGEVAILYMFILTNKVSSSSSNIGLNQGIEQSKGGGTSVINHLKINFVPLVFFKTQLIDFQGRLYVNQYY